MEAEQTTVAVGTPRAKRIRFALKLTSKCIGKVEKQLREAKVIKEEGEEYSEYSNLFDNRGSRTGKGAGEG